MAKNDYDVIVYKILLYYYAVFKREIVFDQVCFDKLLEKRGISDEYFADILRLMQDEGLIEGAVIIKAWGPDHVLASDMRDISITAPGIRYLKENSAMKKIKDALMKVPGMAANLIGIVM